MKLAGGSPSLARELNVDAFLAQVCKRGPRSAAREQALQPGREDCTPPL